MPSLTSFLIPQVICSFCILNSQRRQTVSSLANLNICTYLPGHRLMPWKGYIPKRIIQQNLLIIFWKQRWNKHRINLEKWNLWYQKHFKLFQPDLGHLFQTIILYDLYYLERGQKHYTWLTFITRSTPYTVLCIFTLLNHSKNLVKNLPLSPL